MRTKRYVYNGPQSHFRVKDGGGTREIALFPRAVVGLPEDDPRTRELVRQGRLDPIVEIEPAADSAASAESSEGGGRAAAKRRAQGASKEE